MQKLSPDQKRIFSFRQFIDYCDISESKGYKALHNKELPYFKPGGRKLYLLKDDIDNWLLQGRVPSKSEINGAIAAIK